VPLGSNTVKFGSDSSPTAGETPLDDPPARLVCPTCGQTSSSGNKFCPFDGETLVTDHGSSAVAPDPLLGITVDERYEVLAVIGEGGMGRVYRVRHRRLGRSFALKALRAELARDTNLAERFIQEARAAAVVTHPNVVQINDFGTLHTQQPYFVMELLEGRTLARIIREEGPIEPVRCLTIARQIAEAIAAAHAMGVIHRDLKPDNIILVRPSGSHTTVKVLDFGLAKVAGSNRLTRPGVVFGTPHYMSPEQASGEQFDHRVDIYALGIIMFEMLTGRVPFEADTYMGVLSKHVYAQPPQLRDFNLLQVANPGLEALITGCLAKKLEERWPSMTELARRLNALVLVPDGSEVARAHEKVPSLLGGAGSSRSNSARTLRLTVFGSLLVLFAFTCFAWTRSKRGAVEQPARVPHFAQPTANVGSLGKAPTLDLQPSAMPSASVLGAPSDTDGAASASPATAPRRPSARKTGRRDGIDATKKTIKSAFETGDIGDPWAK
jgi:eukaryotic-like serine/threonine-protein kinase